MRFNSEQIKKIGKEISNKVEGKTLFDEFSRGRYSTDASVYQIKPIGVILPKDTNDVLNIMDYSQKNSIPLLARGGGSSQCGQTVGESLVLDYSRHQNKILEFNLEEKYIWVQPGVVLDHLNSFLKPYGLWFPVDVSTSSRATIGGMSTLVGTAPNIVFSAFMQETYNVEISMASWMSLGVPLASVMLFFAWIILTKYIFPIEFITTNETKNYLKNLNNV